MATVTLYNQEGATVGELNLDTALFEVKSNPVLVHQAVVAQQANARRVLAHTKGRGEVRGGGKKPWKQKHTGRARHGSTRSPIWVGGGITFGPTHERNFAKKMNRAAKRAALAMTLSDKVQHEKFVVVDSLVLSEPKTKMAVNVLKKLPVSGKKTLIVVEPDNRLLSRATKNLPRVTAISAKSLNVVDVIAHEFVLASKDAVAVIEQTFRAAKKT
jgi:large subunit ribosomal protein L4